MFENNAKQKIVKITAMSLFGKIMAMTFCKYINSAYSN